MPDYNSDAYWEEIKGLDYSGLVAAVRGLDESDPNYGDRWEMLMELLMCADMAMGPSRKAMMSAAAAKKPEVS